MKIFFDTEFYEFKPWDYKTSWNIDPAEPELGKQPTMGLSPMHGANAIQLISIGAVREDGVEFYAENALFDWDVVPQDHWIQDNVRPLLQPGRSYNPDFIAGDFHEFCGTQPEFWAWFADYDWVVLCGLYGRMVDLPRNWPMYCNDIKQLQNFVGKSVPSKPAGTHNAIVDAKWNKAAYEQLTGESWTA